MDPIDHHCTQRNRIAASATLVAVLLAGGCGAASSASPPAGATACTTSTGASGELEHTVAQRTYRAQLYRPAGAPPSVRLPVVIDLHGLSSDGPSQAALTRFAALADRTAGEGGDGAGRDGGTFLVVEPTGQPGPMDGATGWEIGAVDEPDRDDSRYLDALIDSLVAEECADPGRIYLAGYSNGGLLAAEYACSRPRRVAAIATVAGFSFPPGCVPTTPVVAFHGTDDPIVPFAAGGESALAAFGAPPDLLTQLRRGIVAQLQASAEAAGCAPTADRQRLGADVTVWRWSACGGVDHELYEIEGGGHTWPGAAEQPDADLLGTTTSTIDATSVAWDLFRRHGSSG